MASEEITIHDIQAELKHALEKMVKFESTLEEHDIRLRNGINEKLRNLNDQKQNKLPAMKIAIWISSFVIPALMFAFYFGISIASVNSKLVSLEKSIAVGTADRIYGSTANAKHETLQLQIDILKKQLEKLNKTN